MSLVISSLTLIAIFGILSVSLGLLTGHLGIFSMAHAALFGIGAYTSAFLTVKLQWDVLPALVVAVLVAGLAGAIMAIPSLRVTGDYFLVASFALQVVASSVFQNWRSVTGGTDGIPGILRPSVGPLEFFTEGAFLVLCLIAVVVVTAFTWFIVHSPFGRMLHVIRDDEMVAATMGKPIASTKVLVTVVSGGFAGAAGVLYGQYLMYISPGSFEVSTSVTIVTMIVVGGMTSVPGTLLGAAIITLIPEAFKFLQLPYSVAGPLQQVFFGLLLVVLMFVRPQGMFGELSQGQRWRRDRTNDATESVEVGENAA
ncbi:branched-chain amino acid ABC transporter permease [Glaciibacter superstes]|uniref:branched-chain amino acid ABC transporter permease n=1 Tax=Glaciibacter superstes TaxID=501023 RepID=UPI0003B38D72|nr:branched-chain amino acid ABC transporter permease [Glaciibacter superstes]